MIGISRRQALITCAVAGTQWPVLCANHDSDTASNTGSTRQIALIAFPHVTLLDLVGPLQVLRALRSPYATTVVAYRLIAIPTDTGIFIQPEQTFTEAQAPYVVVIPGGPGSVAAMGDLKLQEYIRQCAAKARIVSSVCTGALVLAATGLLDGRRACTHWAYREELEKLGAHYQHGRWIQDGQFITTAGVSAGIDMALAIAEQLTDRETARAIQLGLEYDPSPPQGPIDWSTVGPVELARQRRGGTGKSLANAARLLARRSDLLRKLGVTE